MSFSLLAADAASNVDAGKAIALALGIGLGSLGAGIGIGNIFGSMIQAVARQPELRGELTGHPVARLRAHRGRRLLRPDRRPARLRPGLREEGDAPDAARSFTADRRRPGSDDLDARLLRDHLLRPAEVRVRPDPEDDRRAPRSHPLLDRGSGARARRGTQAARGAQAAHRPGQERGRGDPRRGAQGRRLAARACEGGGGSRPAAAGSRRRASRSRPRRSAHSSRSAPRSPSSRSPRPPRSPARCSTATTTAS